MRTFIIIALVTIMTVASYNRDNAVAPKNIGTVLTTNAQVSIQIAIHTVTLEENIAAMAVMEETVLTL